MVQRPGLVRHGPGAYSDRQAILHRFDGLRHNMLMTGNPVIRVVDGRAPSLPTPPSRCRRANTTPLRGDAALLRSTSDARRPRLEGATNPSTSLGWPPAGSVPGSRAIVQDFPWSPAFPPAGPRPARPRHASSRRRRVTSPALSMARWVHSSAIADRAAPDFQGSPPAPACCYPHLSPFRASATRQNAVRRPLPVHPAGESVWQAKQQAPLHIPNPCRLVRQVNRFAG